MGRGANNMLRRPYIYVPPPGPDPMVLGSNPNVSSGSILVYIDPGTRTATFGFEAYVVSGGTPPFFFNWGGGNSPTSASNTATIYLPPGATSGIDFSPGCSVTDSGDPPQVKSIGAGPFFILED